MAYQPYQPYQQYQPQPYQQYQQYQPQPYQPYQPQPYQQYQQYQPQPYQPCQPYQQYQPCQPYQQYQQYQTQPYQPCQSFQYQISQQNINYQMSIYNSQASNISTPIYDPPPQNFGPSPQNFGPPSQNFGPSPSTFGPSPSQNFGPSPQNFGPSSSQNFTALPQSFALPTPFQKPKKDTEIVNEMVLAAKSGEWETVWEILDKKPHIVNCIPKDRAWSALHQAAYLGNVTAVNRLLSYPDCDPEIRTKQDKVAKHGPKKTPSDLTKSMKVRSILSFKIQQRKSMFQFDSPKPTLIEMSEFGEPLGRCMFLTITCCKGYLISKDCKINDLNINTLSHVMKSIFGYINSGNNWIVARDNVSLTLQQYSIELGNMLWTGDKKNGAEYKELIFESKETFFIRAIKLYTGEFGTLHIALNDMLRNQAHKPTSLELSLGPYALLLNSILTEWSALKPFQGTTYRSCRLCEEEADTYIPGRQFAWLSFSSSSKIKRKPSNYLFIIDNRFSLKWAPREIMQYSEYPQEQECLYAFGAKFRVTSVDKHSHIICLAIIDDH